MSAASRTGGLDLHTHTRHSDGTTTPTTNVELAAGAGLSGVALTDHDTIAGWEEAAAAASRHGVELIPGLELSAERDAVSVHVLGYWVDPEHEGLRAECDRLRHERLRRAEAILARLADLGVVVDLAAVRRQAGSAPIGRPHIADALVEAGVVPDRGSAFDRYLADGRPAHVAKHALDPVDAVRLLRDAGGVAVLAHPDCTLRDVEAVHPAAGDDFARRLLDDLVDAGLAALEADHAGHDEQAVDRWRAVARERGLLVTGSSDFHGVAPDVGIGASATPRDVVERLRAHAVRSSETG